jgi:hypothetical protein
LLGIAQVLSNYFLYNAKYGKTRFLIKLKSFWNALKIGGNMLVERVKAFSIDVYLRHPFMWRLEDVRDSLVYAGILKNPAVHDEFFLNDPLIAVLKGRKEEAAIARKYGLFENSVIPGWRKVKGVPIGFYPDSEFENIYSIWKYEASKKYSKK